MTMQLSAQPGAVYLLAIGTVAYAFTALLVIFLWYGVGAATRLLVPATDHLVHSVRTGSRWLSGHSAYITGTHYPKKYRWMTFGGWSLACILASSFGPQPITAVGLTVGFTLVFLVIRSWLLDEAERASDIEQNRRSIATRDDLRLEASLAVALLFGLAAIGIAQLDRAYGVLSGLHGSAVFNFFRPILFVWSEVPESAPIVDATTVFRNGNLIGVSYSNPALALATFGLRVIYELLLVTTVLQLVLVAQRIAYRKDLRAIEVLLKSSRSEKHAEAINELGQLIIRRGQLNAVRLLSDVAHHLPEFSEFSISLTLRRAAADHLVAATRRWGFRGPVLEAVQVYNNLLQIWAEDTNPVEWSKTQMRLGIALRVLGERQGGPEGIQFLEGAAAAYWAALKNYTKEKSPTEWAAAHNSMANVLSNLAERTGGAASIEYFSNSINGYHSALEVLHESDEPAKWAMTLSNLGVALRILGAWQGGSEGNSKIEDAIAAHKAALRVHTIAKMPFEFGMTESNLGLALKALADVRGGAVGRELLEDAVEAFRAALRVYSIRTTPVDFARVQNNLGNALRLLGDWMGGSKGAEKVKAAIAAHHSAQRVYLEKAMPMDWAMSQSNLGIALTKFAELVESEESKKYLRSAIECYNAALKIRTETTTSALWATTQSNLGCAHRLLGDRITGPESEKELSRAVEAFTAALRVRTLESMPIKWASTQNELGATFCVSGKRQAGVQGIPAFESAISAFRQALRVYTAERSPTQWAATHANLALALLRLGTVRSSDEGVRDLGLAVQSFEAALRVYTKDDMPKHWGITQFNMGEALGELDARIGSPANRTLRSRAVAAFRSAEEILDSLGARHEAREARAQADKLEVTEASPLAPL